MKETRECVLPEQRKVVDELEEVLENPRKPLAVETAGERQHPKNNEDVGPKEVETSVHVPSEIETSKVDSKEKVREAPAKLIVEELSLSLDDYEAVKECFDTRNRRVRFTFDDENCVITLKGHKQQVIKATIREMK
ncbi:hypothetical protein SK128_009103, partial [Halocaridina rubra]